MPGVVNFQDRLAEDHLKPAGRMGHFAGCGGGHVAVMAVRIGHLDQLQIADIAGDRRLGPVSYTHLDVYKRQG